MKYIEIQYKELSVNIKLSLFDEIGVGEYHAILESNDTNLNAETQYTNLANALVALQNELPENATLTLKRYFVSDALNHAPLLPKEEKAAVSIVQQPALSGAKVTLWAYFIENANIQSNGENAIIAERTNYRHLFNMQLHNHSKDEFAQTEEIFNEYSKKLSSYGRAAINRAPTLANNCIRTWIYVQGVDTHYADMVKARKLHFYEQGLTEHTHYIASTGIEGKYLHPETTVLMDAYAIDGIIPEQITYLKGATHLNPTHEYGVTFERATTVDYGDRRHIFVSGTASIDNKGQIVSPLNIGKQVERTLENIGVLLHEGGAEMSDIAQLIVYLRDTADYGVVSAYLEQHCPDIPKAIVWAPVCRLGWLVEMECIAVKAVENKHFAAF
jgi:enamine deaminase RidA (YjgF/YER057c/UK114 family)